MAEKKESVNLVENKDKIEHLDLKGTGEADSIPVQTNPLEEVKKNEAKELPPAKSPPEVSLIQEGQIIFPDLPSTSGNFEKEKYQCNEDQKTCAIKDNLERHLQIHSGEKTFKCSESKIFSPRKRELEEHARINWSERPYICDECKKGFTRKNVLIVHLRSHSGNKSYRCNECEKGFNRKSNLKNHLLKNHSGGKS